MQDIIIPRQNPAVTFLTNTFIGPPIIFQIDAIPLLYLTQTIDGNCTTEAQIYNQNGEYIAKWKGRNIHPTEIGRASNLTTSQFPDAVELKLDGHVLAVLEKPQKSEPWKVHTALYSPLGALLTGDSKLVKSTTAPVGSQSPLQINGMMFKGNTFRVSALIAVHGTSAGAWKMFHTPKDGDPDYPIGMSFTTISNPRPSPLPPPTSPPTQS